MRRYPAGLLGVVVLLLSVTTAAAQTTGSINGAVVDNTGAVLPGVTVTASSPVLMGVQTAITNEGGNYRFPALPPGTYTLQYELAGFSQVRREGIVVPLGFTATVNVQLQLATLQETVTVTGESPVVDVTSTTSTFNVSQEMLQTLPNARDIWSVMGQSPGIRVSSIDVGGSRAGTQTGFEAFGFSGQVRVQVDGVNTTEGTGAAGFYYDYGSFDEIQLGGDGMDAQSATPGVQLNAVIKSGGNQFRGTLYTDYENEDFQGNNVDSRLTALGVGRGTRTLKYYDINGDAGGPIARDKLWYYGSIRRQNNTVSVTGFPVEDPGNFGQLTSLQNATYKLTYQMSPNNRFSHYVQYGRKLMPERGGTATRYRWTIYNQDSGSWAGNLEWNGIISPQFIVRAAASSFGYNWPNLPYGVNGELNDNLNNRWTDNGSGTTYTFGSESADRNDRRRWQYDVQATYFKDNWLGGNHSIKFGWVSERESQYFKDEGYVDEISQAFRSTGGLSNFTTPYRVTLYNTPYASTDANWHHGAYVNDSIQVKRVTLSLGIRWDSYESFYPDQEILPARFRDFFYAGVPLQTSVGPYSMARTPYAETFFAPAEDGIRSYPALIAPRFGVSWDIRGDGKTVVKANWGRFHHNTGNASGTVNPVGDADATFDWLDCRNAAGAPIVCPNGEFGDKRFTLNELGQNRSANGVGGTSSTISPDLKDPYTDAASLWFERDLGNNMGLRAGYTFRTDGNNSQSVQLARVYELYTLAVTRQDPGVDGIQGNADDGPDFIWYDIPGQAPASLTDLRTVEGIIATDKAIDVTFTKRMANRFSLVTSYYFNWDHDTGRPQTPNAERFNSLTVTNWNFKVFGTYQAPLGFTTTGSVRHQSGTNISRDITVSGGGLNITGTYEAEPNTAYRTDNVTVLDAKIERRFRFGSHSISAFFDAFNILNTNAANIGAQTATVGRTNVTLPDGTRTAVQSFLRPTSIVPPRIFRVGARLAF
jgi:hypothetical protein